MRGNTLVARNTVDILKDERCNPFISAALLVVESCSAKAPRGIVKETVSQLILEVFGRKLDRYIDVKLVPARGAGCEFSIFVSVTFLIDLFRRDLATATNQRLFD